MLWAPTNINVDACRDQPSATNAAVPTQSAATSVARTTGTFPIAPNFKRHTRARASHWPTCSTLLRST
eukprot:3966717-Alexandrium_andersonii.AAC.1